MNNQIEAMKEALEAFEHIQGMSWSIVTTATCKRNIANLRQAIAQAELAKPEQEPVAWMYEIFGDKVLTSNAKKIDLVLANGKTVTPLYAGSPRKEWVGLADEEIKNILDCGRGGMVDIKKAEQILKEKNT